MSSKIEILIHHHGSKQKTGAGKKAPAYRKTSQVRRLVDYVFSPGRDSREKERVALVLDGLDGPGEAVSLDKITAAVVAEKLCDDVPASRRKIRHLVLSFRGGTIEEQRDKAALAVREFCKEFAPGRAFFAVAHDDHIAEKGRGLHVHLLVKNSDFEGRALDWSPADLRRQQDAAWAREIGLITSRGKGRPSAPGPSVYTKSRKKLDSQKLGELSNEELEKLIEAGELRGGRRAKDGSLQSIEFGGRRIRLSTIRSLGGMARPGRAGRGPDRDSSGHHQLNSVPKSHGLAPLQHRERWGGDGRSKPENRGRKLGRWLSFGKRRPRKNENFVGSLRSLGGELGRAGGRLKSEVLKLDSLGRNR